MGLPSNDICTERFCCSLAYRWLEPAHHWDNDSIHSCIRTLSVCKARENILARREETTFQNGNRNVLNIHRKIFHWEMFWCIFVFSFHGTSPLRNSNEVYKYCRTTFYMWCNWINIFYPVFITEFLNYCYRWKYLKISRPFWEFRYF